MSAKKEWPISEAMEVAEALIGILKPDCERIFIVGSVRRCRPVVGDVELLFIPRIVERENPDDMFSCLRVSLVDERIAEMERDGILDKRPSKTGVFTYGPENKLMRHCHTGMAVDLFATDAARWWNALVVRTGGLENNLMITTRARDKGWTFNAYGDGFTRLKDGERFITTSEESVYKFLKLPYLTPDKRP